MYQVLARQWRPKNFQQLVGQTHVAEALTYALDNKRLHHAYLLTGTRGVGKTTIARILAKSLNCKEKGISSTPCGQCNHCVEIDEGRFPDLIEIDGASQTKADDTRELLATVPYAPVKGKFKVYLIDEVHMLSGHSANALLKTLEEPPPHVKFILATTDPQKLPITVLSRCLQFHLKNLTVTQITAHLSQILQAQQIEFDQEALQLIASAGAGSMRDSLSLLDQAIAFGAGAVHTAKVATLLGAVPSRHVLSLLAHLADNDVLHLRTELLELDQFSPDYQALLAKLISTLQRITILQLHAQLSGEQDDALLYTLAARLPVELIQLWYQIATEAWQYLPYQPDSKEAFEMMLLRMAVMQPLFPNTQISEKQRISEALPAPTSDWRKHDSEAIITDAPTMPVDAQIAQALNDKTTDEIALATTEDNGGLNNVLENQTNHDSITNQADFTATDLSYETSVLEENQISSVSATYKNPALSPDLSSTSTDFSQKQTEQANASSAAQQRLPKRIEETVHAPSIWSNHIELTQNKYLIRLIKNSLPTHWKAPTLTLSLPTGMYALTDKALLHELAQVLGKHYQHTLQIQAEENNDLLTPAATEKAQEARENAEREAHFLSHPVVEKLQQTFDAQLVAGSVKSMS